MLGKLDEVRLFLVRRFLSLFLIGRQGVIIPLCCRGCAGYGVVARQTAIRSGLRPEILSTWPYHSHAETELRL
jgi:hypothetical protein